MAHRTYHPYYVAELEAALDAKDAEILDLRCKNALLRASNSRYAKRSNLRLGMGLPPLAPSANESRSGLAGLPPFGASQ